MLYVKEKETGKIYKVWKYLLSGDQQQSIWSHDWYGHHVIGGDCDFVAGPSTQKNEFVIPDVIGGALLSDMLKEQKEVINSPIRFNGVSIEKIVQVFEKYGIRNLGDF